MKKIVGLFLMSISCSVFAAQYTVSDITKSSGVYFSPGVNVFYGFCDYNWGGLDVYRFGEFMQGASSYSMDKNSLNRCINIEVDIVPGRVTIPYVNQDAFAAAIEKPELNVSRVRTASTLTVGTIFTAKESDVPNYFGWTIITAGTVGSSNYFSCYVETKSLTFNWMDQAGFFSKELTPGYVYEITWIWTHIGARDSKKCAGLNVSLSPALLVAPPIKDQVPVSCPVGCVAAP